MTMLNTPAAKTIGVGEDFAHQLAALRSDVSKLMTSVSDDVTDGLGAASRQIEQTGRNAKTTATDTVIDHPLAAVGIAVGVGLLLGLIARKA